MNRLWLLLLMLPAAVRAQARIENVRVAQRGDSLEIRYNLLEPTAADSVFLRVRTRDDALLPARTLTGDVGQMRSAGTEKVIFWNMNADDVRLDGEIQVEVVVKTVVPPPPPPLPPPPVKPGGGPANALLSAVTPGIGNAFVQPRRASGGVRWGLRPAVAVAFYGLLGYGISQKLVANREYDLYKNSLRESLARPHFEAANQAHHRYYLATRAAAVVWLADVTATLLRGVKNDRQRRTTTVAIRPGPGRSGPVATLSFKHQF